MTATAAMPQKPKHILDQHIAQTAEVALGAVTMREHIQSVSGPFGAILSYQVRYPKKVLRALEILYAEYNRAFTPLVEANREWESDYRFCVSPSGAPLNRWTQIDMVGLPQQFLDEIDRFSDDEILEILRERTFEIENSLAMYQLLERIFSNAEGFSQFDYCFRSSLRDVRKQLGRPVALLAVTQEKYLDMREKEFGKRDGETLTDLEVHELSGFDRFFGPEEFAAYIHSNGGICAYALYVRSSHPIDKLRKPENEIAHPLLADADMRRIIKANSLTLNIDAPEMEPERRINDTKEYMPRMGMGYRVNGQSDILTPEFEEHLARGKTYASYEGQRLAHTFAAYLETQGIDPQQASEGALTLRTKPMKETYGCYGHLTGELSDKRFRNQLRTNIRKRGSYVLQPEMWIPKIRNTTTDEEYYFIDRNFFYTDGERFCFMGGLRSLMPADSTEAQKGRNHGNNSTVCVEII